MRSKKNRKFLICITALLTVLLLTVVCSCAGNGADTTADTDTTADSSADTAPEEKKNMLIDLSSRVYDFATEGNTSMVTVTDKSINTVNPLLFGDNISWRYDGFGLWDSENNRPHEELLEALRNSGVTSLRWPGGIEGDYCHWYEMIGENRVPQLDPWKSRSAGEPVSLYPYFGLEEFFSVCDELGIPAVIQLNCGNGTPKEAADLVKWCVDNNKNVSSFCLGNEMHFGEEMVPGVTVTKKPEEYVQFYLEVYELLGDYADKVEIGICGLTDAHCISYFQKWDNTVLPALGDKIDFLDAHLGYTPYVDPTATVEEQILCYLASATYVDRVIDKQLYNFKKFAPDNYQNITLQITEWGCLGGSYVNTMVGAVFHAALLGKMTEEPQISSTNHFSALLIYEGSPTLIGYKWDGDQLKVFENAMGTVFRWYSAQSDRTVLKTSVDCETFSTNKVGLIPAIIAAPTVYTNVYIDEATGEGSIILVNCNYKKNEKTEIDLPWGVEVTDIAEVYSIDPLAKNNSKTQAVTEKHHTPDDAMIEDGKVVIATRPVSVVKIDFKLLDK